MRKKYDRLTDKRIQNLKQHPLRSISLYDGEGLFLIINSHGDKKWHMSYCSPDGHKQTITFGRYPNVSLEEARKRRAEVLQMQKITSPPIIEKNPPKKYILKIFDTPLIYFQFTFSNYVALEINKIEVEFSHLFPLNLTAIDSEGLNSWLKRRLLLKTRTYAREILNSVNLTRDSIYTFLDLTMALSLSDSYWVCPEDSQLKFSEVNLFNNEFSKILSLVAFTGVKILDPKFIRSPEFTTHGVMPKCWQRNPQGRVFLFKRGSSGFPQEGREPFCEFQASEIAKKMDFDHVTYHLSEINSKIASKCRLFTDFNTSFLPLEGWHKPCPIDKLVTNYDHLGNDFSVAIRNMLVFDALIYNTDRYYDNFGILRDNSSGKIIRPAPLFDHGSSLFNLALPNDFSDLDKYAKKLQSSYGQGWDFDKLGLVFMEETQTEALRRIEDFSFSRIKKYPFSEYQFSKIETFIRKRAEELLRLKRKKFKEVKEELIVSNIIWPKNEESQNEMAVKIKESPELKEVSSFTDILGDVLSSYVDELTGASSRNVKTILELVKTRIHLFDGITRGRDLIFQKYECGPIRFLMSLDNTNKYPYSIDLKLIDSNDFNTIVATITKKEYMQFTCLQYKMKGVLEMVLLPTAKSGILKSGEPLFNKDRHMVKILIPGKKYPLIIFREDIFEKIKCEKIGLKVMDGIKSGNLDLGLCF